MVNLTISPVQYKNWVTVLQCTSQKLSLDLFYVCLSNCFLIEERKSKKHRSENEGQMYDPDEDSQDVENDGGMSPPTHPHTLVHTK